MSDTSPSPQLSNKADCFSLWAKSEPPHPLWCHLIDVSMVALVLWDRYLHESEKQRLSQTLGFTNIQPESRAWFAVMCGLHDIGKASPDFQRLNPQMFERLKGTQLYECEIKDTHHGVRSKQILKCWLTKMGWNGDNAEILGTAIGAHHGFIENSNNSIMKKGSWQLPWKSLIQEHIEILKQGFPNTNWNTEKSAIDHIGLAEFAGMVSYIDWLGSASEFFYQGDEEGLFQGNVSVQDYIQRSRNAAEEALKKCGWRPFPKFSNKSGWHITFGADWTPNPLQQTVEVLLNENPDARFLLIEAPMGEGKTETALYAASYWLKHFNQKGVYLGLPTQATSNAMYKRVDEWVSRVFETGTVESLLVHGGLIHPEYYEQKKYRNNSLKIGSVQEFGTESGAETVADEWFLNNKRALLAPFGTGTIDQALIGALRCKHWFVRLSGLAGKTIIFDEIHAYDAYTSELIARLLEYLARLECTVVLLSATLPASKRQDFVKAFTGKELKLENTTETSYPLMIAWPDAGGKVIAKSGFETSHRAKKSLALEQLPWNLEAAVHSFVSRLGAKGCGAFLVNTVDEAQQAYRLIKAHYASQLDELILFHARFTAGDRSAIEKKVLQLFGKGNNRPKGKAILVATQVVEQSLDLDFDLMATTIAPIDLILQRSGRLHRHERSGTRGEHESPILLIRSPEGSEGFPNYESTGKVYDPIILARTQMALVSYYEKKQNLEIPRDVTGLIDLVYEQKNEEGVPDTWRKGLSEAKDKYNESQGMKKSKGNIYSNYSPNSEYITELWKADQLTSEDDIEKSGNTALTRLGDPTKTICIIWETNNGLAYDQNGQYLVNNSTDELEHREFRLIAENCLKISEYHFLQNSESFQTTTPKSWKQHRMLREIVVFIAKSTKDKESRFQYSETEGFLKN
ncbi:MAG: CRISPR-associated helicase Cas3' [Candidatus Sumerlaeia bacterium]|nr:CRISPR-associated helicase Cas3' [Candidatus Sumerlaeia bacterium]